MNDVILTERSNIVAIADAIRTKTERTDTLTFDEMADAINDMELNGNLNFEVVGGASVPLNPNVNTIWVNTESEITSYIFSAFEPESPVDGAVWIAISNNGYIKATSPVESNWITVCPVSAKQHVNGMWEDKVAKSYQDGTWVDLWNGKLYEKGDEYTSITGGFIARGLAYSSSYKTAAAPGLIKGKDYLKATQNTSKGGGALICTNKIDLTDYKTLHYAGQLYSTTSNGIIALCVWKDFGTYKADNLVTSLSINSKTTLHGGTVDISEIVGEYYIGFYLYHTGSYINLTHMWLE